MLDNADNLKRLASAVRDKAFAAIRAAERGEHERALQRLAEADEAMPQLAGELAFALKLAAHDAGYVSPAVNEHGEEGENARPRR